MLDFAFGIFMNKTIDIKALLEKPIWQMSGSEFCALIRYASRDTWAAGPATVQQRRLAHGVRELAEALSCSESKIYMYMRANSKGSEGSEGQKGGVLHDAIVSHIGRRIVFDIDAALAAIKENNV